MCSVSWLNLNFDPTFRHLWPKVQGWFPAAMHFFERCIKVYGFNPSQSMCSISWLNVWGSWSIYSVIIVYAQSRARELQLYIKCYTLCVCHYQFRYLHMWVYGYSKRLYSLILCIHFHSNKNILFICRVLSWIERRNK